jgi:hypothetical protein
MGGGQTDQFVLKLFAQEVGETLLILILKETTLQMEMGGGSKNTKQNKCHPSRGERIRDHKPSDISVRRVRVICCSIQVLQQPGVNTVAASHPLRLLLLLLLLLTMCKTGLWKERNSSDKNVTHHPKKKGGESREKCKLKTKRRRKKTKKKEENPNTQKKTKKQNRMLCMEKP